jgi:hypothetical protein
MISYNNFRRLLSQHILVPCRIETQGFSPTYSTNVNDFSYFLSSDIIDHSYVLTDLISSLPIGRCIFWHEEPLNNLEIIETAQQSFCKFYDTNWNGHVICRDFPSSFECQGMFNTNGTQDINIQLLANSEKSTYKKNWLKENNFLDWYFFFHGFAALDWFQDYKYLLNTKFNKFDKVFICLNNLLTDSRSYRLYLLANLYKNNLIGLGYVSAAELSKKVVLNEVVNKNSFLSKQGKKNIYSLLDYQNQPITLDNVNYKLASANISNFCYNAMWFVVTETIFFEEKLHLTEKIFKPIAIKRPFILCGAPGNLQYLKSYGFKTFDRWIDESYDNEPDPEKRLDMITKQLQKLCSLSEYDLNKMYEEMTSVLEYNFDHFFNNFKTIIIDELLDNFEVCIKQYNLRRYTERFMYPQELFNKTQLRELLLN